MSDGVGPRDPGEAGGESRDWAPIDEGFEVERTEREALRQELDEALRKKQWATGWLMTVGFGPAAIVAVLLALFVDGSRELAIGFALLGAAVLALRAYRADQRIKELERALQDPMDGS